MKTKVLFVVRALPYESSGTPIVIRNLLSNLPIGSSYILGRTPHPKKRLPVNNSHPMVEIPILYTKGYRIWKYYSIIPGFFLGIWMIKKFRINKIIGVFQDDASLLTAYLLSLVFPALDFYPYLMDLYADQKDKKNRIITDKFQYRIFKRAKKILVINDGMKNYLRGKYCKYKFETVPIIALNSNLNTSKKEKNNSKSKFLIVFSGSVNEDRLETLQIFSKIIAEDKRFSLKYLTNQYEIQLRNLGIFFDGFQIQFCKNQEELFNELNNADLLYLPLRFNFPDYKRPQMLTCFGAKVYDYLNSTTPILIHAPKDLYNYTYFQYHNASFLLDSLNVDEIKQKLEEIFIQAHGEVGNNFVQKSNFLAKSFSGENVKKIFLNSLEN